MEDINQVVYHILRCKDCNDHVCMVSGNYSIKTLCLSCYLTKLEKVVLDERERNKFLNNPNWHTTDCVKNNKGNCICK